MYKTKETDYKELAPGMNLKTVVHGEKMLMIKFSMEGGQVHAGHNHPYEQTGTLLKGKIKFTIGGEVYIVEPGDCWSIPAGVEHQGETLEASEGVEVYSPAREDYLAFKV
ncbi:MAG: cupin domain-containing protein [Deltaproteobacteria bacterium]|nr:cupin domain-containing protein [Deltaproteobacteria bacterium]